MTTPYKPKRKNKRADQARALGELLRIAKAVYKLETGIGLCSSRIGRASFDLSASLGREALNVLTGPAFRFLAMSAHDPDADARQAAWLEYAKLRDWAAVRAAQASAHYSAGLLAEARRAA